MEFKGWAKVIQIDALRQVLAEGLQTHFKVRIQSAPVLAYCVDSFLVAPTDH